MNDSPRDGGIVLVTGASGFIATQIVRLLMSRGFRVRGSVRSLTNEVKVRPLLSICPGAAYPLELVEADLNYKETWDKAVQGCRYVMHVASPYPSELPRDPDQVILPAVNGTLAVLEACRKHKVKRVVLTSSIAAIFGDYSERVPRGKVFTEDDWTNIETVRDPYLKSKTLAERAAWRYMSELPASERFELAVVNPTIVLGPVLSGVPGTNAVIVMKPMVGQMPLVPRINVPVVDVRDVALAHLRALLVPEAAGRRTIVHSGENVWFLDLTRIMNRELKLQGYHIQTTPMPCGLLPLGAAIDGTLRMLGPAWDKVEIVDNSKMREILKIDPVIDLQTSIIDMAYSIIDRGFIRRSKRDRGRENRIRPTSHIV